MFSDGWLGVQVPLQAPQGSVMAERLLLKAESRLGSDLWLHKGGSHTQEYVLQGLPCVHPETPQVQQGLGVRGVSGGEGLKAGPRVPGNTFISHLSLEYRMLVFNTGKTKPNKA